ncbi:Ankyrin repeat [Phytophthora cinnamomi]|nr:Ankyrin repeat [Phytophthora cinnamomi]
MATHYDEKCRRCSCRRKACQRRRAQHRRQVKCLFPNAQFLLVPSAGALFRRQYPIAVNHNAPPFEIEGGDEIAIDSEDLKVMRESVDTMRQQLRRGLRDIEEIRNLIKRVVAQRDAEKRELSLRDGAASLAAGAQRTRKKKRRENASDDETAANISWLASVLHPEQQTPAPQVEGQTNEIIARSRPVVLEKQAGPPRMSVEALEQKKMLLPYLDKIEYINCQLR